MESFRDDLTAQGFKIAKRLTPTSVLADDAVRNVLARLDQNRQAERKEVDEKAKKEREAEDNRRKEGEIKRRAIEEEQRRKAAEESRRKADEQLARLRTINIPTPPAGPAGPAVPVKPSLTAPPPVAPSIIPAPTVEVAKEAPIPAPPQEVVAKEAVARDSQSSAHVPTQGAGSAAEAEQGAAPAAPPLKTIPPRQQPPAGPASGNRPTSPRPSEDFRRDNRPSQPGSQDRPRYNNGPAVDRRPTNQAGGNYSSGGPRPQGGTPRPQGGGNFSGGPRPQGGGNFTGGPRPQGGGNFTGGPRTNQGPGGPRGPQQGMDRDRRPTGAPGGAPKSPTQMNLERFANAGMEPKLEEEVKRRRERKKDEPKRILSDEPRKPKTPLKGATPGARREPKRFKPAELIRAQEGAGMIRSQKSGGKKKRYKNNEIKRPETAVFVGDFTVGEFAEKAGLGVSEVMGKLLMMGEMLTINEVINPDLAELLADEFEIKIEIKREDDDSDVAEYVEIDENEKDFVSRPPVVTVMGHVDHGKTTLLDCIRKANVVDGEAGGITQHIGAYYVHTEKGDIVFLDTPGHEAFTAMRARGADVTDLVILVVAANDGVKPQTVEAINHAKAAEVPIIVAINKIDVPGANPSKVKQELMAYNIVAEEFGGDTLMVEVSAKHNTNVQALLELVALQSEILELKANPKRDAIGTIVESHLDPLRGAVATVLIQQGTLRMSDLFVCGTEFGRIRAMADDKGNAIEEAGPARPVEILGISRSPKAGDQFVVLQDEVEAREIAEKRQNRQKLRDTKGGVHVTLDTLSAHLEEGKVIDLNLIIKADVQGSAEAIVSSLLKIKSDKITLKILHKAVGPVGESDVQLADASDAIILAFNVRPETAARDLAESLGVEIKMYNIIYDLLEEIEKAMIGMLAPEFKEVETGRVEIREIFKVSKVGNIAGCFVTEGAIQSDSKVRLVRGGTVVWSGGLKSLRRVKDEVKEVKNGVECGIHLEGFNDIKVGDVIEAYKMEELAATLMKAEPQKPDTNSSDDDD
ncbi:MAG: translation initiation factor IF-2 [Sumerlaeia bacterium]